MSGTIPLGMTQQMDVYGDPLAGGKLYFFVAGTVSTPQNAYQDTALTILWPNPITLDASGRIPQFFLADGVIKIRLTDLHGVTQLVADNVQVIGPSAGGGGGGTVDPTTIYQTGDLKPRYGIGAHTGWVQCNGRTIGSATSGATERQNADTQALFQYLWNIDPTLPVSGGRGASSLADWSANKTIALPDWRGCVIGGLDGMGSSPAGRLTTTYFGPDPTILGAGGGGQSRTLLASEAPAHAHNIIIADPGHVHTELGFGTGAIGAGSGSASTFVTPTGGSTYAPVTAGATTGITASSDTQGGNQPHAIVQPTRLCTIYMKL